MTYRASVLRSLEGWGHKRTNAAPHGGASSSARRRNSPQDVPENTGLHLKRSWAVVLVVSRGHHDNEIELRDDANRLPASTKRTSPVDLTPIEQGTAEPPEISIEKEARGVHPRCHRGVDPCLRNDLAVVPAATRKDKLADFCHIAWSQAQSPSGIGVALDPNPLEAGDAQGLEQHRAREFVEGTSGSLADYGRHERQRAGVVEELLSWRGRRRKTEDV